MILLSFSSAVKYVLSMMLAVLGIIPFEDIEVNSLEKESVTLGSYYEVNPLEQLESKVLPSGDLFIVDSEFISEPRFIPARNDHALNCNFSDWFEQYEFVHCSIKTEVVQEDGGCSQIIIYFNDTDMEVKTDPVYLLSSDI